MSSEIEIWNLLHDGEITVVGVEGTDLVLFVDIPYLRERLRPLGDSFRLVLKGFRGCSVLNLDGRITSTDVQSGISKRGLCILWVAEDKRPVTITTNQGFLTLDYDSAVVYLDTGELVSVEEIDRVATAYWDEFEKRSSKTP